MTADSEEIVTSFFGITHLKEFQKAILHNVAVKKKDCLLCVPTGSGKSICYQALPLYGKHDGDTTTTQGMFILVSPLVNLINIQVENLNSLGFPALSVVGSIDAEKKKNLENGSYSYLVGNPESFLDSEFICGLLKTRIYQESVSCLIFDEVHTAVSWGLSTDSKPAFRSFFSKVGDLRAKLPKVPILCLTATASKSTLSTVKQLLALREPYEYIASPDRQNIRLYVKKVSREGAMQWIVDRLLSKGKAFPKTIVYCRSIRECAELYGFFEEQMGKNTLQLEKRKFDMVHSKTIPEIRNDIVTRFSDYHSELVVVFATKILGMGIDIECSQIVHYGPPGTVDDYIQQIGRAGRSGNQAHAILLFHGKQLRNLDSAMRKLTKCEDSCVRQIILEDFDGDRHHVSPRHLCCNVCAVICSCGKCVDNENSFEEFLAQHAECFDGEDEEEEVSREVSENQRHQLHVQLIQLKSELDRELLTEHSLQTPAYLLHGLDDGVISSILEKTNRVFSVDDIIKKCDISQYGTACRVLETMATVFDDVDVDVSDYQDELVTDCHTSK